MCRHEKRMHSPELKGHIARKTGRMWLTFHRLHIPENSVCVLFFFFFFIYPAYFLSFVSVLMLCTNPRSLQSKKKKKQLRHQMEKKNLISYLWGENASAGVSGEIPPNALVCLPLGCAYLENLRLIHQKLFLCGGNLKLKENIGLRRITSV